MTKKTRKKAATKKKPAKKTTGKLQVAAASHKLPPEYPPVLTKPVQLRYTVSQSNVKDENKVIVSVPAGISNREAVNQLVRITDRIKFR